MDPVPAEHVPPPAGHLGSVLRGTAPLAAAVLAALALHFLIVPNIEQLYAKILLDIGINVILAVSLNIVNGMTGQFSIGHAGFMAIGGYTAAAITYYGSFALFGTAAFHGGILSFAGALSRFNGSLFGAGDLLFVVALLVGGLTAAAAGFLVGLPSLRLRGDYLAIVTLGFGEIIRVLIEQTDPQIATAQEAAKVAPLDRMTHLGGALGFAGVPFYTTTFWVALGVGVTLIVAYRLRESTYGRAFFSIRENEIAAEAMGVPTTRYKVAAFVIAAFFAGIAGGLFAHQLGVTLNPTDLGFLKSFDILIMVVLGGMGSITGSVLAAIILTILPELLRDPPAVWPLGLVLVTGILIFRRRRGVKLAAIWAGLIGGLEVLRQVAVAYDADLSKYRLIFYALALILMMIWRPNGLLGVKEIWHFWPWNRRTRRVAEARPVEAAV